MTDDRVIWGSSRHHFCEVTPIKSRRRCPSCPKPRPRITHAGTANGVALMSGCEWHVRQWAKEANEQRRRVGVPK